MDADTGAVMELADHLAAGRIGKVTLESTSDYWRIWFYLLEARGLDVQLVNARDVKRSRQAWSDKLDCVWQAKLTERGMLRPSFVPPAEIRRLRDYTRLRADLTRERTRHWSEKLLEDALIKVSRRWPARSALSRCGTCVEALIAGERDPQVLAGLARGKMRAKHDRLVEALTGRFGGHHGELARMLLDQIDALAAHIDKITGRAGELITAMPGSWGVDADGVTGPGAGLGPGAPVLPVVARLDEITGIGAPAAQAISRRSG